MRHHTCLKVVFPGFASAGAVLADISRTIRRAKILGERVASQIGRPFDTAIYLGPEEEGSCPYCHLLKIEYREGNKVMFIVCGAHGELVIGHHGDIRPTWDANSVTSALTLKGLQTHRDDVMAQLAEERPSILADFPRRI